MSSTKQKVLTDVETLPDWLVGFDDPVIRTQGRGNNSTMHRPDPAAESPQPACSQANAENSFVVAERSHLEAMYHDCKNPGCFGGER